MILAYMIIFFATASVSLFLLLPFLGAGAAAWFWRKGRRAWASFLMLGMTGTWAFVLSSAVDQKRDYCTQAVPRLLTTENLAHHEKVYGVKFSRISIHPDLCSEPVCVKLSKDLQRPVRRLALVNAESKGRPATFPTSHDAAGDLSYLEVVHVQVTNDPPEPTQELVVMNSRVSSGIGAWVDSAMWLHNLPGLLRLRDCVAQP